jgi:hypothetical protein
MSDETAQAEPMEPVASNPADEQTPTADNPVDPAILAASYLAVEQAAAEAQRAVAESAFSAGL